MAPVTALRRVPPIGQARRTMKVSDRGNADPSVADPRPRCGWVTPTEPLYVAYHDAEWGVPLTDDRALFEALILDGAQAGLSWLTILKRREGYRRAFEGFDAERIARWGEAEIAARLQDPGIIRNRAKVEAAVGNARAWLVLRDGGETLAGLLWGFVDGVPRQNRRRTVADLPAETDESRAMARELKRRGFRFVGPTVCYALMQAAGLVNDHTLDCFRHDPVAALPPPRWPGDALLRPASG
ncbi:MAG TPA: DNA-3-methyladenine glycosylase I [Thermoanaerobaculia bacterium]|nr:DNA-3-methyladenine glycosylase I [Thermoanaerobaculia bacterium]